MRQTDRWYSRPVARLSRRSVLSRATVAGLGLGGLASLRCGQRSPQSAATNKAPAGAPSQAAKPGGVLNTYSRYNAPLDPNRVSQANTQVLASGAMSRLLRFKTGTDPKVIADHSIESDLALTVESPDAATWTIKLRPDAKFHDIAPVNGHAVEAADVKATLTRALTPENPNRGGLDMIDLSHIETPAQDTLTMTLKYPFAPFPNLLASPGYVWVFPREVLVGAYDPAKQMIGSGPFILASYTPDVGYVFKKNPDWFFKAQPYVDSVQYAVIPDLAQVIAQFTAGHLDELVSINPNDLTTIKANNPKATVTQTPVSGGNPIYFQLGDPSSAFRDIRVRQAFSMALDRDTLGKAIFNGQYDTPIFVPPQMGRWAISVKDLDPTVAQYYKYNPDEAKKLLAAAGATNLDLKLAYITNGGPVIPRSLAEAVADMLNRIGEHVTIVEHDYNKDFVDSGKGSRQGYFAKDVMVFGGQAHYDDADTTLFSYFHSKSTSNSEHLGDPTLDAMIDKERTLVNEDERLKSVRDIQKYIAEHMYVVSTVGGPSSNGTQPWVQNYCLGSQSGTFEDTYAKLWLAK